MRAMRASVAPYAESGKRPIGLLSTGPADCWSLSVVAIDFQNMNWMIVDDDWETKTADRSLPFGGSCITNGRHRTGGGILCQRHMGHQGSRSPNLRLPALGLRSDCLAQRCDPTHVQCGMTIIWGLEAKGPTDWTEGSILDSNNGKTYQLSATYELDGTLHARIFRGVPLLGKTEILKRVDVRTLTGQC